MKFYFRLIFIFYLIFPFVVSASNMSQVNSIGMGFIVVPEGKIEISDEETIENSKKFYIQTTEVTQSQWNQIMGFNPSFHECTKCPVENVTYNKIQLFIKRLNIKEAKIKYRLPSYDEWRFASYKFNKGLLSVNVDDRKYAWYYINSKDITHKVGVKESLMGVFDMFGNVSEVTSSTNFNRTYSVLLGGNIKTSIGYNHIDDLIMGRFSSVYGFRLLMSKNNKKSIKISKIKCKSNKDIVDLISNKSFGDITIDSVSNMKKLIICDSNKYKVDYGMIDYSSFRNADPYIDDIYFLDVESKIKVDLDRLKKRLKELGFRGMGLNDFGKKYSINWVAYYKDYGCLVSYYGSSKKISIQWQKLSASWQDHLLEDEFINENELKKYIIDIKKGY